MADRKLFALDQADGRHATFTSQDGERLVIPKVSFNEMQQPKQLTISIESGDRISAKPPGPKPRQSA